MLNLIAATGTAVVALILALMLGVAASFRFYGTAVLGVVALILAPFLLLFGLWLKGHKLNLVARFFLTASATLVIGVVAAQFVPRWAPGTVARIRARFQRSDDANSRTAIATLAPRAVPCSAPLVGQQGEALYWWHPQDEPIKCYDRSGKHPEGKGELAAVDDAIAQLIVRKSVPKSSPLPMPQVAMAAVQPEARPAAVPTSAPELTPEPTPPPRFQQAETVLVLR
jgi:hypothetical protein